MSSNSDIQSQRHNIEANDSLIRSVIVDQTDNLEKGWREGIQNGIDSPNSTEVKLSYDSDYTLIRDDGDGVELSEEEGLKLLTVMGNSSKAADDSETVGEFGIGKGQIIAKGKTVFFSGDTALAFDIKGWGLAAETVPLADLYEYLLDKDQEWAQAVDAYINKDSYDGLGVLVSHYEDEVPSENSYKWNSYKREMKNRFAFVESVRDTEVHLNGTQISDKEPVDRINTTKSDTHHEVSDLGNTGSVEITVEEGRGSLEVHSGGIYVTDVDSRGIEGTVVTDQNLRLNFARNEIKSGCPIWNKVEERLNEIRRKLFSDNNDNEVNQDARKFVAQEIKNHGTEDLQTEPVFQTATESLVSFNEIVSQSEIAVASTGNPAADRLEEAYGMIVLDNTDPATKVLIDNEDELATDEDLPGRAEAQEKAKDEGLMVDYEQVNKHDLAPRKFQKLGIAKLLAEKMDIKRKIDWGKSDIANAWTDGTTYIRITETAAPDSKWVQWVPQMWRILCHEDAHKYPDKEEASHGRRFDERFRQNIDNNEDALADVMEAISQDSLSTVAEYGHNVR